jgi:two-component system, NarL family, nitrate/nitrite response regulator NarL
MRRVSLVIADPHPVVVCGLTSLLNAENDFHVVASFHDGRSCIQAIRDLAPDIALLDMSLPGQTGLEVLAAVTSEHLPTRIVFLTAAAEDRDLIVAVARGAYGIIHKDAPPDVLVQSLRQVAAGRRLLPFAGFESQQAQQGSNGNEDVLMVLTEREREIVRLVSEGLSNKEVGRQLNISDGTIKVHLHHVYQKLAISNRTALAALTLTHHDNAAPSREDDDLLPS